MQQREDRTAINDGSVLIKRPTEKQQTEYKVLNISRGGLCFQSQDSFELNETVELDVQVKNEDIHHAQARICYRNHGDNSNSSYGLSFLDSFIDNDLIRKL